MRRYSVLLSSAISIVTLCVATLHAADVPCPGFELVAWRCDDVSPRVDTFPYNIWNSVSGRVMTLAVSDDGRRLYAGGFSGVWRSDDAGANWQQLAQPQPPSGMYLFSPMPQNVYTLVVSPLKDDPSTGDILFAGTMGDVRQGRRLNAIYRSSNSGGSWTLAHSFDCPGVPGGMQVGQIVIAPDNPYLMYAAGGCAVAISYDGGVNWTDSPINGEVWHVAVAEPWEYKMGLGFVRRVYAAGPSQLWYSEDGGVTWQRDRGIDLSTARGPSLSDYSFGKYTSYGTDEGELTLAVKPRHPHEVFMVVSGQSANGPSFFQDPRFGVDGSRVCEHTPTAEFNCGGASLWIGDFTDFETTQTARWQQIDGPPRIVGRATGSGSKFVAVTWAPNDSYLVFFSDADNVYEARGTASQMSRWHRLGGDDISDSYCSDCITGPGANQCDIIYTHVDVHAIAVSPDYDTTLPDAACGGHVIPLPIHSPYNVNSAESYRAGKIWLGTDGGVYRNDGGKKWTLGAGLSTLQVQGPFAGLLLPGKAPALYFGGPDNDNYFSPDGGATWRNPLSSCGDCGAWFSDPLSPGRVLESNRPYLDSANGWRQAWTIYAAPFRNNYPDPSTSGNSVAVTLPAGSLLTDDCAQQGYRPVIFSVDNDYEPPDGDFIFIQQKADGSRVLLRNQAPSSDPNAWASGAFPVGALLPPGTSVAQAAGGHRDTIFYVGNPDSGTLWRWPYADAQLWVPLVPSADGSAKKARRFFVDPFDPKLIYIIDEDAIKRSEDGGKSWQIDVDLDTQATENHTLPYEPIVGAIGYSVIRDMIFVRGEPDTRFVIGEGGVFMTRDGKSWTRLLSTRALACHPVAAFFDGRDPQNRTLYVATNGRGILRLSALP